MLRTIKKLLKWRPRFSWCPRILLATLVVAAFTAGGGIKASYASPQGAQELVDKDPAITAYRVFKIPLNDDEGTHNMEYRLPLLVPMPNPDTHYLNIVGAGPHLSMLQFDAKDGTHLTTIIIDSVIYEGIIIAYYNKTTKVISRWKYDKNGNPVSITVDEQSAIIDTYRHKKPKE